jgi:hypothetical protein
VFNLPELCRFLPPRHNKLLFLNKCNHLGLAHFQWKQSRYDFNTYMDWVNP